MAQVLPPPTAPGDGLPEGMVRELKYLRIQHDWAPALCLLASARGSMCGLPAAHLQPVSLYTVIDPLQCRCSTVAKCIVLNSFLLCFFVTVGAALLPLGAACVCQAVAVIPHILHM